MRGFFDFESGALEDEIAFDGVIYNSEELKRELRGRGVKFTKGDALEICLKGYREYGGDFFRKINGAFALALWDGKKRRTVLCRDKIGIKPLYYTRIKNKIFFGSKIQDVLEKSGIDAVVTKEGLCEIFALGPVPKVVRTIFFSILRKCFRRSILFLKVEKRKRAGIGSWKAMYMKILSLKQWRRRHG